MLASPTTWPGVWHPCVFTHTAALSGRRGSGASSMAFVKIPETGTTAQSTKQGEHRLKACMHGLEQPGLGMICTYKECWSLCEYQRKWGATVARVATDNLTYCWQAILCQRPRTLIVVSGTPAALTEVAARMRKLCPLKSDPLHDSCWREHRLYVRHKILSMQWWPSSRASRRLWEPPQKETPNCSYSLCHA